MAAVAVDTRVELGALEHLEFDLPCSEVGGDGHLEHGTGAATYAVRGVSCCPDARWCGFCETTFVPAREAFITITPLKGGVPL